MSYKTILVHVDDSAALAARVEIACKIARQQNAYLIGAATTGVSQSIYQGVVVDMSAEYIAGYVDSLQERAAAALESFAAIAARLGVDATERRLVDDETSIGINWQARYCDLVVLGQPDPAALTPFVPHDFPQTVALHSGCPVLVVPYAGQFTGFGKKMLVAWDGSREAKQAVRDAIPLLQQAKTVEVAVFNPSQRPDTHGEQPGADIALYLARHGIRIVVREIIVPHADIGDALLSHMADIEAGQLVMGCYGHSRFHEILLGGVSRTVLSSMTAPVLMSH